MISKIVRTYSRHYADNGQVTAYVEWLDHKGRSGRTEGRPDSAHMQALIERAEREGVPVQRETW
jgi:hypothetical protein